MCISKKWNIELRKKFNVLKKKEILKKTVNLEALKLVAVSEDCEGAVHLVLVLQQLQVPHVPGIQINTLVYIFTIKDLRFKILF